MNYFRNLYSFKYFCFAQTESLDESFKNCDEQEPYIPPETPENPTKSLNNAIKIEDYGQILKNGKNLTKRDPKSYAELINDKSHINEMRDRYKQYSLIREDVDDEADKEYDDEYDDSYEVFADTEPRIHIRGRMRDALPDDIDSEPESEEEPEEKNEPIKKNPLDFCENPEIIRARRQQQFQQKLAKKFPQRSQPSENKTRDVAGNPKGQGQSNEVLRNRQQKSAHKSSRANHNRKAGSSFKQSRGMF